MQEATLLADPGRELGSASTRRLRKLGQVPGVLYGKGGDATTLSVPSAELRAILVEAGGNAVIRLNVGGEEHLTLVKDIQRHPVRNTIDHIDFQLVSMTDSVHVEVAIHLIGEAELVNHAGGVVEQAIFHVHVHCSPVSIPAFVEADISDM
ncbi:MAG: 50S ribosomal protein L25, partial [Acidimicrobiales bacterium]